jgi:hypothetical protein
LAVLAAAAQQGQRQIFNVLAAPALLAKDLPAAPVKQTIGLVAVVAEQVELAVTLLVTTFLILQTLLVMVV